MEVENMLLMDGYSRISKRKATFNKVQNGKWGYVPQLRLANRWLPLVKKQNVFNNPEKMLVEELKQAEF